MAPPDVTHLGRGRHAQGSAADPTEPVSANPAAMRTYATDAAEKTEELRALVGEVSVALANYRQNAVLAGAGFAPQNELSWHDGWTDADGAGTGVIDALLDLCDDFDHLDAFVGSVADAVYEAEGLDDDDPQADQVYSLTAGDIADHGDIDGARREFSNEDAQQDAAELQRLLDDLGIDAEATDLQLDLNGYAINPMDAELTQETYDQLVVMAGRMDDENYAATVYNELGPTGTDALMQFIDRVAIDHEMYDTLPEDLDVDAEVVQPFAEGFAAATHTMDQATMYEYVAMGDSAHGQLHLSMLLSADGSSYQPQLLADAAEQILVSGRIDDLDSFTGPFFEPDGPREAVLATLAQNSEASWTFASNDPSNLEYLLRPSEDPEQAALVFEGAFLQAPLDDPDLYPEALDLYGDVVSIVGDGDIPDELRIATAGSLVLYIDDIGASSSQQRWTEYPDDEARAAEDFNRPDLVSFFQELGRTEQAAMLVGNAVMTWSTEDLQPYVMNPDISDEDLDDNLLAEQALIMGAIQDGFDEADDSSMNWLATGFTIVGTFGVAALLTVSPDPATTAGAAALMGRTGAGLSIDPLSNWLAEEVDGNGTSIESSEMERIITDNLIDGMAVAIANQHGLPAPQPGDQPGIVSQHFPGQIDPVELLDIQASDAQDDYTATSHWSSLMETQ